MAYRAAHHAARAKASENPDRDARKLVYCQLKKKNGTNVPITTSIVGSYKNGGMAVIFPMSHGIIHEQLQEMALEAAAVGIWWLDLKSDRLVWDQISHRLYGWNEKNGWTPDYDGFYRCVHPEDRTWLSQLLRQCINRKSYYRAVFRVIRPDQEIVYIRAYGKIFTVGDAQVFAGVQLEATPDEYDGGRTQELGTSTNPDGFENVTAQNPALPVD